MAGPGDVTGQCKVSSHLLLSSQQVTTVTVQNTRYSSHLKNFHSQGVAIDFLIILL